MSEQAVSLDLEVVELLAEEPELLAIADAVAATQARWRRRLRPRLLGLAAALAVVGAVIVALPHGEGQSSLLSDALAAIGNGPVVHARIEARLPDTTVIELATGRATTQTVTIEYWFDEPRGRLRTVVRRGGLLVQEFLEAGARGGLALDPALAGFVTRYREALAKGRARLAGEGEVDGRRVVWLVLGGHGVRERVAVDAETYAPVLITPLDRGQRAGALSWRVRRIETVARVEADFARPGPQPARPFRGDVRESRPVSSAQVSATVTWPALWLGESWRGLRLVALEHQTLTRGYPPESRPRAALGEGVRLRYAVDSEPTYVEVLQAPFPEPAYAFLGGAATFNGNPIPREGSMELVEIAGRARTAVGQLRRDGVYVTIWASSGELCLEAARALKGMTT